MDDSRRIGTDMNGGRGGGNIGGERVERDRGG